MLQKEIDIVAGLIVKGITIPLVLIMTTLERYMDLIGRSRKNFYLRSFFLFALIIIVFIHFYL